MYMCVQTKRSVASSMVIKWTKAIWLNQTGKYLHGHINGQVKTGT